MASWIDTRKAQSERANLTILFDKYVPYCLEQVRCNLKTITPIPENSMVQVEVLRTSFIKESFPHYYYISLCYSDMLTCFCVWGQSDVVFLVGVPADRPQHSR